MRRRTFLQISSLALLNSVAPLRSVALPPVPIIDTHIHLFDPSRPQGVPWPEKTDHVLSAPALPPRYSAIAKPFGVIGAIAVECSPWKTDNSWLLNVAETNPIIVGVVGNLDPGSSDFQSNLEFLVKNSLFRGIRYGNLWNRDLGAAIATPAFVSGLRLLAQAGLVLDSANPNPALIAALLRTSDLVPELRVVIDHLPQADPPNETSARAKYASDLRELGRRPTVFVKISEVLRRTDHGVPEDLEFYRPRLDELWNTFGEDRLMYGSDWPNSEHLASYSATFGVVRKYVAAKPGISAEKFFWKTSRAAYRWHPRDPSQSELVRNQK